MLQSGYIEFLLFFEFDPKTQNFDFSKVNFYKIQNFRVIQKTGIYVVNLHTKIYIPNFKAISLYLAVPWLKNRGDDVTFLKYNFWHLIAVRKNK